MTAAIEVASKAAVKIVVNAVSGGSSGGGSGTVTNVTGTAPISVATGTTTPVVSIAAATTLVPGSMSAADKTKLDGVATGATANATDAQLRDRSTHTGTQDVGTITGLATIATSGSATDLSAGTVPSARLASKAVGGQGAGSTVTEPTVATSLLTSTVTIPACAAGDVLLINAGVNFTQSATSKTYTFALKLGATTMLSVQPTVSQSATARVLNLQAVIRVLTTTSQAGAMTVVFNTNTSAATAVPYATTGTATETISSGSLALDFLVTTSASGTTQTLTLGSFSVVKVAA